jgi:predicted Holliday junction resolvase-like endonuclease
VDYVVFEGLADGRVDRVVFLEVKTGRGTLNGRERQVRDAIEAGRVAWAEWRIAADGRRSGSR